MNTAVEGVCVIDRLANVKLANRVLGIGSPHGDDQAAWRLVERLRNRKERNASMASLSDASQLLDFLDHCDRLIIVDACAGGGSPGTITRLEWPDARIEAWHSHSTHGMSVAYALQLAEKLGLLPLKVVLFGIELSQCQQVGSPSEIVEKAISELVEQILLEIR